MKRNRIEPIILAILGAMIGAVVGYYVAGVVTLALYWESSGRPIDSYTFYYGLWTLITLGTAALFWLLARRR